MISLSFSLFEKNGVIENYCSNLGVLERKKIPNYGVGLATVYVSMRSLQSLIVLYNNNFIENYANSMSYYFIIYYKKC